MFRIFSLLLFFFFSMSAILEECFQMKIFFKWSILEDIFFLMVLCRGFDFIKRTILDDFFPGGLFWKNLKLEENTGEVRCYNEKSELTYSCLHTHTHIQSPSYFYQLAITLFPMEAPKGCCASKKTDYIGSP